MRIVHTAAELRAHVDGWRAAGERVGFVPTMGNLHSGHLALVAEAQRHAPRSVVSVFVNPLQFGPNEDYGRYPRTLPQDAAQLEAAGVDVLFAPAVEEVYVNGYPPMTKIVPGAIGDILEGEFRPGFFTGVATVVNILFALVRPDLAVFGEKDYQQLQVVRRMVSDLRLPIEIVGLPTERAADGLALSSRNQYLDAAQRAIAPTIYAELSRIATALKAGERDYAGLCAAGRAALENAGFRPQYLEVRARDLSSPSEDCRAWVVLVAAFLGTTRLIDNLPVEA